jgi:hypothetical protein
VVQASHPDEDATLLPPALFLPIQNNLLFLRRNIKLRCWQNISSNESSYLCGQKNKDNMKNLLEDLVTSLLPREIYEHFSYVSISEKPHGIEMRLDEYPKLVPSELSGKAGVVLDGFCNPLELLHFSVKGKLLYLKIYRRRWKESGSKTHYSNQYELHPEGVKATHEFAAFLKITA